MRYSNISVKQQGELDRQNLSYYISRREEAWDKYFYWDREAKWQEYDGKLHLAYIARENQQKAAEEARFYDGIVNGLITSKDYKKKYAIKPNFTR